MLAACPITLQTRNRAIWLHAKYYRCKFLLLSVVLYQDSCASMDYVLHAGFSLISGNH